MAQGAKPQLCDNSGTQTARVPCPLLAQSRRKPVQRTCPLSGAKQTWPLRCEMSANDPKQTLALPMRLPPWQPVLVQLSLAFEPF